MKPMYLDIIARLVREAAVDAIAANATPNLPRRLPDLDAEKFLRLRKEFDEKYAVSTPTELMRF